MIRNLATSVAGHFDFYFCKEYQSVKAVKPRKVAHILHEGLIASGIAEDQIAVLTSGKDVIFKIFDSCEEGDLLVMLMGHHEKEILPGFIREYAGMSNST